MALFQYFKKVEGNYPGTKLPDPRGALSKEVPSCSLSATSRNAGARPKNVGVAYLKSEFAKLFQRNFQKQLFAKI